MDFFAVPKATKVAAEKGDFFCCCCIGEPVFSRLGVVWFDFCVNECVSLPFASSVMQRILIHLSINESQLLITKIYLDFFCCVFGFQH